MAELSNKARVKSATVAPSKGYPTGRFPIPNAEHARLALQMLPRAKGLSSSEEAQIRARANRKLAAQRALKG